MKDDLHITIPGFLSSFFARHRDRPERPFCFVLGAGASKPSGIPTGGELASQWLKEIHELKNLENLPLKQWATEDRLEIKGFSLERAAEFYPDIYQLRYGKLEEDGYAFLEKLMEGAEPSYGYSVLSYLLSETRHKVVVTTNFDNLVADALSIHSTTFPKVIGNDELVKYVRADLRRPLIAKIHGDLGFSPKNNPEAIRNLPEGWCAALTGIFGRFTPIFIGYGGNDGSLMGFLEKLPEGLIDTVYWCYHNNSTLNDRIIALVRKLNGSLVEIEGFDELMIRLQAALSEIPDLLQRLRERSNKRIKSYEEQKEKLGELIAEKTKELKIFNLEEMPSIAETKGTESLIDAATKTLVDPYKEKPWWVLVKEASDAVDPNHADAIYKNALQAQPRNSMLLNMYANFLDDIRKDYDKAEEFYKRAIEVHPQIARNLDTYATFLTNIRKDHDKAEEFFKRAIEVDPKNASSLGFYAMFLTNIRKDHDKAEEFIKRAIEVDPKNVRNLKWYAIFLTDIRKDHDKAEEFFKRVIEADPKNARNLGWYAIFLDDIRKDYDKAEEFIKRAIEADPKNANSFGLYAIFLTGTRKDHDKAEEFFKRAIGADPKNAASLCSYADFFNDTRKDYDKAEEFFKRAIEADPKNADSLSSYANFLGRIRKDHDKAEEFFKRSIEADPKHANNLCNYAKFLLAMGRRTEGLEILDRCKNESDDNNTTLAVKISFYRAAHISDAWPAELTHLKAILKQGARSPGWEVEENILRAKQDGHPEPDLLHAIAMVINDDADMDTLESFETWRKA